MRHLITFALLLFSAFFTAASAADLDLTRAVLVTPPGLAGTENKAAVMLAEEVEKRTQIRLARSSAWPAPGIPVIAVGPAGALKNTFGAQATRFPAIVGRGLAEGFSLWTETGGSAPAVWVAGRDARGVLYGTGYLLRQLRTARQKLSLPENCTADSAPQTPLRGIQLGYRPKTNSYDGWNAAQWEQYIRELAFFGCNAIELIPPVSDDAADSPHFPQPQMQMMVEMSRLASEYGMDVWIWYPAMAPDYSRPETVQKELQEWGDVFRRLPRVDAVFVPGGDPGHTPPRVMFPFLEKQTANLRQYHPKAAMWLSPQGFHQEWMEDFYELLKPEPAWLGGIVHGPQVRPDLPELRRRVPRRYPIRDYPDITHTIRCQFAVPRWDTALVMTLHREPIIPRPMDMAAVFRSNRPHTAGFIVYSEGCNDDVNKIVWLALGWDPQMAPRRIVQEYGRVFISSSLADDLASSFLGLEDNLRGPLLSNEGVLRTLQLFQNMEQSAPPAVLQNWRFQMALYRAYYDAFVQQRLRHESSVEDRALRVLEEARRKGTEQAMTAARAILDQGAAERVAPEWRMRTFQLAEALFQSIHMQLSVPLYQAIARDRGANLDNIDVPLNNRMWLERRFQEIRQLPEEAARLKELASILEWTNPGPGGFYDDLGAAGRQPHLVSGASYEEDPGHLKHPFYGISRDTREQPAWRLSQINHAEIMWDAPLEMHYRDLDPQAVYRLRVLYGGETNPNRLLRLTADGQAELQPYARIEKPAEPVEYAIPASATADGELRLQWSRKPGLGGNGRGCQVAEVWLIRK